MAMLHSASKPLIKSLHNRRETGGGHHSGSVRAYTDERDIDRATRRRGVSGDLQIVAFDSLRRGSECHSYRATASRSKRCAAVVRGNGVLCSCLQCDGSNVQAASVCALERDGLGRRGRVNCCNVKVQTARCRQPANRISAFISCTVDVRVIRCPVLPVHA